eukprot:UN16112
MVNFGCFPSFGWFSSRQYPPLLILQETSFHRNLHYQTHPVLLVVVHLVYQNSLVLEVLYSHCCFHYTIFVIHLHSFNYHFIKGCHICTTKF